MLGQIVELNKDLIKVIDKHIEDGIDGKTVAAVLRDLIANYEQS